MNYLLKQSTLLTFNINNYFYYARMYTFDTQTCTLSHSKSVQLT